MTDWNPLERFLEDAKTFQGAHISKLRFPDGQEEKVLSWIKRPQDFLIFQGTPGTGKTYSMIAVCRYLFDIAKKKMAYPSIFFYPNHKIFQEFREIYQNKWSDSSLKNRHQECLLLAIDDFGNTRFTQWEVDIISEIVDERYKKRKPTILSTNLTFEDMREHLPHRVVDRLEGDRNVVIENWGESLRRKGL